MRPTEPVSSLAFPQASVPPTATRLRSSRLKHLRRGLGSSSYPPACDNMPDLTQLALFSAAALLLAFTPGPGMFYVAARTLAGGRAEGMASSLGTGLGGTAHVVAGALGVSALVLASAELFTALKLIGAVYLAWLGFRTIVAAREDAREAGQAAATPPVG